MARKMTALLIGNANYPDGNGLANPVNDAMDLAQKLRAYGFETIIATDASSLRMKKELKKFRVALDESDVGLFFFAGHGMQIEGVNYLLANDTDMETEEDAQHSSLSLDLVVSKMAKSKASTKIIILDACRKNPWERRWDRAPGARGLASVYAPKGTIIGFATSPGEVASDGTGRNGTYTAALLQHIDIPDTSIETMFKRVRNEIAAATMGKQTSWEHTSLSDEFYFNLSVTKLVDEYDGSALADGLFVIDASKKSHEIITALRSHNYYTQNPAIDLLTATTTSKINKNNLFVIGRNIYQAACGNAHGAVAFISDFASRTSSYPPEKRKALLDGMLFEIFFNGKGELREDIKEGYFSELFALQRHPPLKSSFGFIADVLAAARADFYALPGKGHEVAVTIATKARDDRTFVEAIYVGALNVLRQEGEIWETSSGKQHHYSLWPTDLEALLSSEMVVPAHLLKVTYTPPLVDGFQRLSFPMGCTVRKA
ncbi:peptidase C14 [Agrobacterium salinitolerans]|nr:peptidase C14 [Agrobacterium salinitolerans]